jgi:hypothetical protein
MESMGILNTWPSTFPYRRVPDPVESGVLMVDRYLKAQQVTHRVAIRELIERYAYFADRRGLASQIASFTEDTAFLVFLEPGNGPGASRDIWGNLLDELDCREFLYPADG